MKLIVGLGNPGSEYAKTRHNVGWCVVDELASRHGVGGIATSKFSGSILDVRIAGEKVLLIKPLTFMNRSGQTVGEACRFYKVDPAEDLLIVVDEVALPVGHIRLRSGGGANGHNGLGDIDRALGTQDYPRLRVGVGAVPKLMVMSDWVLSRFMEEERGDASRSFGLAADAAELFVAEGVTAAMNQFNKRIKAERVPEHPNETSDESAGAGREGSGS